MLVGAIPVLAGLVLAIWPFEITVSMEGRDPVSGRCGRPICIAHKPTSGWIAYAPNAGATFMGGPCAARARRRLGAAASLVLLGVSLGLLV